MTFRLSDLWTEIWPLCIHRPQTWHLLLRLGLHETTAAFTHLSSVYVSVVFVCCVYVLCTCHVFVFLRYPELQQSLSVYLYVSNVITLMSVNTSNPVTAM